MFRPVRIKIKNFLSIRDIEYIFKQGETILVQGINLTDLSQKSNGSGKSAFQAAIDFVLTNSCARKLSSDRELIFTDEEESLIEIELSNTLYRCELRIQRTLSQKNSSTLKIWENEELVKFPTVPEGNKLLSSILGLSSKDIHNYYLPNELTYVSFFRSSDSDIKDLISRFSKTDVLDGVFKHIDVDIKAKEKEVETCKEEYIKFETEIGIYQSEIEIESKRDFKKEKEDKVIQLNSDIDNKKIQIKSQEQLQESKKKEVELVKKDIEKIEKNIKNISIKIDDRTKDTDRTEFFKEAEKIKGELNKSQEEEETKKDSELLKLENLKSWVSEINTILAGEITCPKCQYKFVLESDKSIEDLKKEKQEFEVKFNSLEKVISEMKSKIQEIKDKFQDVKSLEDEVNREIFETREEIKKFDQFLSSYQKQLRENNTKLTNYQKELSFIESKIVELKNDISSFEKEIKEVKESKQDKTRLNGLKDKKKTSEENLEKKKEEREKLEKELFETQSWVNRFKSFKSYLTNKQLKAITGYTNKYLRDFGTDIEVSIEGYKQLSSGEIREKITPYVYRRGKVRSYGSFSKGERGKIDYSVMLALQTLINLTATTGGLDLMFSDEVVEGMDSLGLSSLLVALSQTKKTNLVTTHMVEQIQYDNVVTFVKENNITVIK